MKIDAHYVLKKSRAEVPLLREAGIKAVFLNGGKAASAFQTFITESLPEGVTVVKLPSSSPAHAALSFEEKLARWKHIGAFLDPYEASAERPSH